MGLTLSIVLKFRQVYAAKSKLQAGILMRDMQSSNLTKPREITQSGVNEVSTKFVNLNYD